MGWDHEEEWGSEYADILIEHGFTFGDLDSDSWRDQLREEYYGVHPMADEFSCDVAESACEARVEEMFRLCPCGQLAMKDSDLCADCRIIAEATQHIVEPQKPSMSMDLWSWMR